MVQPVAQTDHAKRLFRVHRVRRDLGHKDDVLQHGQAWDQIVELEDETDVFAAVAGKRRLVRADKVMIAEPCLSAGGGVEPAKDVEQGGLAAAGRTEQHEEFEGLQIHRAQCDDRDFAHPVGLGQTAGYKDGSRRASRRPSLRGRCKVGSAPAGHHPINLPPVIPGVP